MKKLMAFVVTLIGISSFASSYRDGFVINDVEWGYVVANGKAQICDVRAKGGAWLTGAVSVPNEVAGYEVTEIGSQAFKNESKITSISIPDGVRLVGSSAFSGCAALQSVSFPASLESVGKNAFEMCVLLKEITLPSGVRRIEDNTFDGCSSLEVVGMPAELEAIGSYAFQKCSSLKSISIVADIGELVSIFGSDSDIAKYLRDEKTLEDFNVFLSSCGVASADQITAAQKQYAYQSFKLSEITTAPRLFEDEPVLKIDDLELNAEEMSFTISLTAGSEAI